MSKLQFIFVAVVVCAVAFENAHAVSEDEQKQLNEVLLPLIMECSGSVDDLAAVKQTKDVNNVNSCLIECVFKKMEIINNEGKFVPEKFKESMQKILKKEGDAAKLEEGAKNCASVNDKDGEDSCAKSKALLACLMEQKDLLGL